MLSMRSNQKCFALVDCNNFYASCERLFNPKLNNKPLIVLSSNDGCVIARSNEAKALGIQMSQPYFQIEKLCRQHNVQALSSNFALYGDISNRVMKTLNQLCPDMEIYSVDEAFLRLDHMAINPAEYAIKIKETILQHVGIPVSVGLAPSKTLAKAATSIAKKNQHICVYDLRSEKVRDIILQHFPVREIWGVGKQSAEKLNQLKIHTASQLCDQPALYLRKKFSVMMTRVVMELKGTSCIALDETHNKKNIICSRSFSKHVNALSDLSEAISAYAANACKKARAQKTKAHAICVTVSTSRFSSAREFYSASDQQTLLIPSNDTFLITKIANELLKKIFKPGFHYQKAGIILLNLMPENIIQSDLFEPEKNSDNRTLMSLLDCVNKKWGLQTLFLAAEGTEKSWTVKSTRRSPRYTTSWSELLKTNS
ncbi:MAG: Y-family DNA polymerase [Gammaproteobacteria bacterium]|nr:Y-family DNA polymerase [Gammaproteobacteria bacterium]